MFLWRELLSRRELLIERHKKLYTKDIKFSIITNGTLLDLATCKELISYGVREIEISLDATNLEIHQKIGRSVFLFDKIVEGLNDLETRDSILTIVIPYLIFLLLSNLRSL